jgi:hypothetical protein
MNFSTKLLTSVILSALSLWYSHGNAIDPVTPEILGPMRVMMLYEADEESKLPPEQLAVIQQAKPVYDYLNSHCGKDVDGQHTWRIWDDDTNVNGEVAVWQTWMKEFDDKPQPLPFIRIQKGRSHYKGPLPKSVEETEKLLKKYGGP